MPGAEVPISTLPAATTPLAGTEVSPIVQGGATKKVAVSNFGPAAANPAGTVGLAAVNGAAATFMRSDAAPPLSQAIAPTWSAKHIFSVPPVVTPSTVAALPGAPGTGARSAVTDANATLTAGIGAVVAGGGANIVPVFFDGTNWRIG